MDPITILQQHSASHTLTSLHLSPDGANLHIPSTSTNLNAASKLSLTLSNGKTVSYSLASVYLQIADPARGLMQYRKVCESHAVSDPVKVLDKSGIIDYFMGKKEEEEDDGMHISDDDESENEKDGVVTEKEGGEVVEPKEEGEEEGEEVEHPVKKPSSKEDHRPSKKDRKDRDRDHRRRSKEHRHKHDKHDKHHKDKHSRDKDRHHRDHHKHDKHHKDKHKKEKKSHHSKPTKAIMTNEQLMQNLNTVVDKRSTSSKTKPEDEHVEGAIVEEEEHVPQQLPEETKEDTPSKAVPTTMSKGTDEDERETLQYHLSFSGFEFLSTNPTIVEQDREKFTDKIISLEIPVGDSSSVLRAGAGGEHMAGGAAGAPGIGPNGEKNSAGVMMGGGIVTTSGNTADTKNDGKRDFARVLELYAEMIKVEEMAKRGGSSHHRSGGSSGGNGKRPPPPPPGSDSKRRRPTPTGSTPSKPKITGKPIIVVPNAMTSPITVLNAIDFFKDATYVPRDIAIKKGARKVPSVTFKRRMPSRMGGHEYEYEIIDNPITRLKSSADWSRIVAVIAQGAPWQFKGWKYSAPVDVFGRSFGFYVGMDDSPLPKDVTTWNVKIGRLNRDRRGLDNVTFANFWNGLDQWMSVHKKEYFPTDET